MAALSSSEWSPQVILLQPLWVFWGPVGSEVGNKLGENSGSVHPPCKRHPRIGPWAFPASILGICSLPPYCPSVISLPRNRYLSCVNYEPVISSEGLMTQQETRWVSALTEVACFQSFNKFLIECKVLWSGGNRMLQKHMIGAGGRATALSPTFVQMKQRCLFFLQVLLCPGCTPWRAGAHWAHLGQAPLFSAQPAQPYVAVLGDPNLIRSEPQWFQWVVAVLLYKVGEIISRWVVGVCPEGLEIGCKERKLSGTWP